MGKRQRSRWAGRYRGGHDGGAVEKDAEDDDVGDAAGSAVVEGMCVTMEKKEQKVCKQSTRYYNHELYVTTLFGPNSY